MVMLSYIRKYTGNWGLKIIYFIVALTFLGGFGGIFGALRSCGTGMSGGTIAIVNRKAISTDRFNRTYRITLNRYAEEYKHELTPERAASMHIPNIVLTNLITNEVGVQQADDLGFIVTGDELRDEIVHLPAFLNKAHQFDPRIYYGVLRENNITPGSFQQGIKDDILTLKLKKLFFDSVFLNGSEIEMLSSMGNKSKSPSMPKDAVQANLQFSFAMAKNGYDTWIQDVINRAKANGAIQINVPLLAKFTQTSE